MLKRLAAILALLAAPAAHAGLVTLEIEARFVDFGSALGQFYADTGISPNTPFTWLGRITLDTDVAPDTTTYSNGSLFAYNGGGSMMSATVGNLTVTHDAFTVLFAQEDDCDRLIIGAANFFSLNFASWSCGGHLPDYTMTSLLAGIDGFGGSPYPSVITHGWQILGNVNWVRQVPEPSPLVIFGLGLAGLLSCSRRRYAAESR